MKLSFFLLLVHEFACVTILLLSRIFGPGESCKFFENTPNRRRMRRVNVTDGPSLFFSFFYLECAPRRGLFVHVYKFIEAIHTSAAFVVRLRVTHLKSAARIIFFSVANAQMAKRTTPIASVVDDQERKKKREKKNTSRSSRGGKLTEKRARGEILAVDNNNVDRQ